MKKVIFLDIDGTLIDTFGGISDISLNVKAALRFLQSQGHYVFIATGRPISFLSQEILNFDFDGYVLSNGAHVIIDNKTIYNKSIDKNFISELVANFDYNKIQYMLGGAPYSYINKKHKDFLKFYTDVGLSSECFKTDYNIKEVNIHKVEMFCENKHILNHCKEFIDKYPQYDYFHSISEVHLELYFKENTKAVGILKALEYLNIPLENTYAFGDGKNDIEMLSTVGCGIAMGNASEEVKQYAKEITDTVHNDGVAVGIKQYVL